MGRPHKCPYCDATDTVSKGVRKTKTMGNRRIRLCKACKRKFTPKKQKSNPSSQDETRPEDSETEAPSEPAEQPEETSSQGQQEAPAEEPRQLLPPPSQEWTS